MDLSTSVGQQTRRRGYWPGVLLVALFTTLALVLVLIRRGLIPYNQREVNKRYLNPLMLRFAGQPFSPQAVVLHTGRTSGRRYATPVALVPVRGGFIIPLPYGADVDWCRNLLAAGRSTLRWHGTTYEVMQPEILDAQTALSHVPLVRQRIFRLLGMKQVLQVMISAVLAEYPAVGH